MLGDDTTFISMELSNETCLSQVFQEFGKFLMACGYSPESIKEWIDEE
jgi:hypothetical protein